jgi:hypothetical protein
VHTLDITDMQESRNIKLLGWDLLEFRERVLLACLPWLVLLITIYEGFPFVLDFLDR